MKKLLLISIFFFTLAAARSQTLMTVQEAYDYNTGDIFVHKWGGFSGPPNYIRTVITNKYYSTLLDTLFYDYDAYSYSPPGCQTCSAIYDTTYGSTLYYTNLNDTIGAGLGVKPYYWNLNCIDTAGFTGVWLDTVYYDSNFCNREITGIRRLENGPFLTDSCYWYFEPFLRYDEYGRGIGQRSYYFNTCAQGTWQCEQGFELLYYKKGTDSCGTMPFIPIPNQVPEIKPAEVFTIYPNPFTSETQITFSESQRNSIITVMDLLGREVRKVDFYGKEWKLERGTLKKGMYIVQVNDGNHIYSIKIIVQ